MANCKTCPACGATLDFGEICDCKGRGKPPGDGRVDKIKKTAKQERAEAIEKLRELEGAGRVSYRLVARPDFGPTLIVADVDGEPAYQYRADYDDRRGIWWLHKARVINDAYRCLSVKSWVYIDDVKDARSK